MRTRKLPFGRKVAEPEEEVDVGEKSLDAFRCSVYWAALSAAGDEYGFPRSPVDLHGFKAGDGRTLHQVLSAVVARDDEFVLQDALAVMESWISRKPLVSKLRAPQDLVTSCIGKLQKVLRDELEEQVEYNDEETLLLGQEMERALRIMK